MTARPEPFRERLDELAAELAAAIVDDFDPDLPTRPEPAEVAVDHSRLLFDSERHWWEQYRAFKTWQGKDVP